jgi:hypothetical protein
VPGIRVDCAELARLARALERDGQPVQLKVGRRPVGVTISLRECRERFALGRAMLICALARHRGDLGVEALAQGAPILRGWIIRARLTPEAAD